jgi:hypothetical protein|tara:strand:- start:186 stop:575 length:390 start_codon:yes stop_codon:yes gene_type:complete
MGKILTEISEAELLDKISILEIKLKEIKDPDLLKQVDKEYKILINIKNDNLNLTKEVEDLFLKLKNTNAKIWQIENEKRLCEKNSSFGEKFIKLSRDEFYANDERAKIKSKINNILNSNIKEVKQHTKY